MSATKLWELNDGRFVRGCRELGCYSATFGAFCTIHAELFDPKIVDIRRMARDLAERPR